MNVCEMCSAVANNGMKHYVTEEMDMFQIRIDFAPSTVWELQAEVFTGILIRDAVWLGSTRRDSACGALPRDFPGHPG